MIPVRLQLTGFLSYRETVEISFELFSLACISGHNGAGKSSILDGITWALFDRARGSGDEVINSQSNAAEVIFDFDYEGALYRVQRSRTRGKTALLEFYIHDDHDRWRPLTEATIRATEAKIEKILRLDYETFINASFFLQGKADRFAQQSPGDRKKILASVLGLEIWESYRMQAARTIRMREQEKNILLGQLQTYDEELTRESEYKATLEHVKNELANLDEGLKLKTAALDLAAQQESLLQSLRKSVDEKTSRLQGEQQALDELQQRLADRTAERDDHQKTLAGAAEIERRYKAWLDDRKTLEHWESLKSAAGKIEEKRVARQSIIEQTRAGLQAELNALQQRQNETEALAKGAPSLEQNLSSLQTKAMGLVEQKENQTKLNDQLQALRLETVALETKQKALQEDLSAHKERINRLGEAEEETCPVCKKPLTAAERQRMVADLEIEKSDLVSLLQELTGQLQLKRSRIKSLTDQLAVLRDLDGQIQQYQQAIARDESTLTHIRDAVKTFHESFLPRLTALEKTLKANDFEPAARKELSKLEVEVLAIGYDAAAHEKVRQTEQLGRSSEEEMRRVDTARAALGPLEREIKTIQKSIETGEKSMNSLVLEKQKAEREYHDLEDRMPDMVSLEREVYSLKEQANRKRNEVGAAENKISNLKNVQERRIILLAQRDEILRQISRLKDLERAFSKDGVPALLIEQALPEIESQANELLERLSNGNMSLKFETQAEYKNNKRTDKKETLEIKISDSSGNYREYEMYSGGEAFRVDFAIRLALSRVLAHRAGARLQTLVIDEGFGSQDTDGRQRLIEAINQVRGDFEKILVITHLDELKDAFPARIEVEKGASGSTVQVQVL